MGKRSKSSKRFSVSLPLEDYEILERIANRDKISVAWLVRAAVRDYLEADVPLLKQGTN